MKQKKLPREEKSSRAKKGKKRTRFQSTLRVSQTLPIAEMRGDQGLLTVEHVGSVFPADLAGSTCIKLVGMLQSKQQKLAFPCIFAVWFTFGAR